MNEFRTDAFTGYEKQIRDARLVRSAVIGEAIGNGLAAAWFGVKRLVARLSSVLAATRAARRRQIDALRSHASRRMVTTLKI